MSARHMAMRSISRAHMTACKAVARARATYNASIPSSGRHWTGCSHKKNAAYESPLATCTERSAFCAHLLPEEVRRARSRKARGN